MLVLGAPGHGRLTDVVALSALAPQLSSHVACPVVVVHGDQIHPSDAPILVGIDGSPLSEQALAVAFEEASLRGVALTAIHAWEGWHVAAASAEPFPDWPTLEQMERLILAERLADWSDKYPDVTVYREITQRGPGRRWSRPVATRSWSSSVAADGAGSTGSCSGRPASS